MALVGYARVSSLDQNHSSQVERLKAAGCSKIFAEKKSGTKTEGRSALEDCLEWVREGDVLMVTKIDRLARSTRDLHNLVHELDAKGVSFQALDQAVDTSTPHGKAFLGMLAIFAEFETNLRKERQFEGIAQAKKEGKFKGRKPTVRAKKAEIEAMLAQGMKKTEVAAQLGIHVQSIYKMLDPKNKTA